MPLWSRFINAVRGRRLDREIDEELASHLAEAVEGGRDPDEARRALGSGLRLREESHDIRVLPWLDSLRADLVFAWRQVRKQKAASGAAVLSLGLALGACTSLFRLIDALVLRPLPVAHPEELYALFRQGIGPEGKPQHHDGWAYPDFRLMRAAVKGEAELIAVTYSERMDIAYGAGEEIEKARVQYVSGWMFSDFGLKPALGRLLTANDDVQPGSHPYAVISHDYWTRRFGGDHHVIGRTMEFADRVYEIVGVGPEHFTGTEPGTMTDIFVPTMMHGSVTRDDSNWFRTLARIRTGVALEPLRARLDATSRAFETERSKGFHNLPPERLANFLNQTLLLEPAARGLSDMQQAYRRALTALAVLVGLVLLIACANVANLMTAQATARSREMALRVSIGAGRWRLVQLVMAESALLALLAASAGAALAWWSAPFVVSKINPPDNPARLELPADPAVLGFGVALTVIVALLFGLAPALRASAIQTVSALKGEERRSRQRVMHGLIAAQVAFCFVVLFAANLCANTFRQLSEAATGFSTERLLALDAVTTQPRPPAAWEQVAEHLRGLPGVERVALADRALMGGNSRNNFVSVNGVLHGETLTYFRYVGPGWMETMKIPLRAGRDFRADETSPGVAIVNETFAKQYFGDDNPVGKSFDRGGPMRYEIVGVARDAVYRDVREPMLAVAFVPLRALDAAGGLQPIREGAFLVRTTNANPLTLAATLRKEVARVAAGFRVTDVHTQLELVQAHTVRERLLAMLASFFAVVALLLAGIGIYGVLDHSVLQRRREIGILLAVGVPAGRVAGRVVAEVFAMVGAGAAVGSGLGLAAARYVDTLLYGVKPTEPMVLLGTAMTMLAAAAIAAVAPAVRAVRTDPMTVLRVE